MLKIKTVKMLRDYELNVDIGLNGHRTLVLMGNNGSGKTTVLNMVSGILSPDSGTIEVSGRKFFDSGSNIDVPLNKRNIGYVFQNYALFPHMTVMDNVAFGLRMKKMTADDIKNRVKAQLDSVGLWELRNEKAIKLSGGQKQRVALARALVIKPDILLLDEPLSALDVKTQVSMRAELRSSLKETGLPCIIVTHNIKDAVELGEMVYIMDQGRVAASGEPSEVLRKGHNDFIDNFYS
ncbi:ABC transporter [Methanocella sp. CWC-04]|uniref:Molybdate/tungstate import ATP-binding protein WtpC n=1 Tax=Methanooceanicella nereidis TaxID=2052831 RepID=A0AAP2RBC6_9EURY|nr:ABC transporter ATP-binding protein [Methanocella sp. CWC-04]MCD1294288.1 ABC transporter [Methanocella sp. CWC-04]